METRARLKHRQRGALAAARDAVTAGLGGTGCPGVDLSRERRGEMAEQAATLGRRDQQVQAGTSQQSEE